MCVLALLLIAGMPPGIGTGIHVLGIGIGTGICIDMVDVV